MRLLKTLYNFFIYNTENNKKKSYKSVNEMIDDLNKRKRGLLETIDILFCKLCRRLDIFIHNVKNDIYLLKHRYEKFEYDYMYYTRLPKLIKMLELRKADLYSGVSVSFMIKYGFNSEKLLDFNRAVNLFNLYLDIMIRGFELQLRVYDDLEKVLTKEEEEEVEYGLSIYKELLTLL